MASWHWVFTWTSVVLLSVRFNRYISVHFYGNIHDMKHKMYFRIWTFSPWTTEIRWFFLPGEAIDWPRVHKRIPTGNFLSVTGSLDGERAYMKLREESLTEKIDDDMGGARSLQLLGTPLEVLRIQIEEEVSFDNFKACFNSLAPGGCGSEVRNMIF